MSEINCGLVVDEVRAVRKRPNEKTDVGHDQFFPDEEEGALGVHSSWLLDSFRYHVDIFDVKPIAFDQTWRTKNHDGGRTFASRDQSEIVEDDVAAGKEQRSNNDKIL